MSIWHQWRRYRDVAPPDLEGGDLPHWERDAEIDVSTRTLAEIRAIQLGQSRRVTEEQELIRELNYIGMARLAALGVVFALAGCVTVENSLSQNDIANMKLTGRDRQLHHAGSSYVGRYRAGKL